MEYRKKIGWWLMVGVVMLMIQVVLGGITRLTGSGLSITEWKPIMGFIPPLNQDEWLIAFEKYKNATGQFKYLNSDFSLSDFKFIFFWEWFHRNWARFIGVAFLIPFCWFLYKRAFSADMIPRLIGLFLLGIGQGLIGWIMVQSGLTDDNLYVNHIRLAIHFISALILVAFTFWFALTLLVPPTERFEDRGMKKALWIFIGLLGIQLCYGAFMAGLKAGNVAATWPDINGEVIPASLSSLNVFSHPIAIHFLHRTLAYLLLVYMLILTYRSYRTGTQSALWKNMRWIPLALVVAQIVLGIGSVLWSVNAERNGFGLFEWTAQCHQIVAMLLGMSVLYKLFLCSRKVS